MPRTEAARELAYKSLMGAQAHWLVKVRAGDAHVGLLRQNAKGEHRCACGRRGSSDHLLLRCPLVERWRMAATSQLLGVPEDV